MVRDKVMTIEQMALEELNLAGGDVLVAAPRFANRVMSDAKIYRELMDPLVQSACYDALRALCRAQRRVITRPPVRSDDDEKRSLGGMHAGVKLTLYEFRLPGGKFIGDAVRSELVAAGQFYGKQAHTMRGLSDFYGLVVQEMPVSSRKRVRNVVSLEQLEALYFEAGLK